MARTYDYTISLDLPKYGMVTAVIGYHVGFAGSYWEPPDSDEVTVESLVSALGEEIQLSDEEWEEFYPLFLQKGEEAHSVYMEEWYKKYAKDWEEERDLEIPY
jgi:hypothetical protein